MDEHEPKSNLVKVLSSLLAAKKHIERASKNLEKDRNVDEGRYVTPKLYRRCQALLVGLEAAEDCINPMVRFFLKAEKNGKKRGGK